MMAKRSHSQKKFTAELQRITNQILDRSKIIPIDYVLDLISTGSANVPDCTLILRTPKLFRTADEIRPGSAFLILPYLSFQVRRKRLVRFENAADAYDSYDQCKHQKMETLYDNPFFVAFVSAKRITAGQRQVVDAIAQLMGFYFHFYEYPLLLGRAASRYAKLLATRQKPPSTLTEILQSIANDYKTSITHVNEVGGRLAHTGDDVSPTLLTSPILFERFRYATVRGRTASSSIKIGRKRIFFTLVPHTNHSLSEDGGARCILLSRESEPLEEQVAFFVSYFLSSSTRESVRVGQSTVIEELNDIRGRISNRIRLEDFQTHSSRQRILSEELEKWCQLLAVTIGAHSVTIRLFDRFSNSLNVFVSYDETVSQQAAPKRQIPVGSYFSSLNAAVFRLRAPSNPVRIDDVGEMILPWDLRAIGFEGPLAVRPTTASEICAPIWNGDTPIGTINLESPEKRAFRNDDLLVGSAARYIGDLFSLSQETLSLVTLRQLARANDAAHGVAGLEFDTFLQTVPQAIRARLPTALLESVTQFEEFRKAYRKDILDSETGAPTIEALIGEIRLAYSKCLVPLVSEPDPERFTLHYQDKEIAPGISLSILRLAELVFENAAKHSRIDLDEIRIFVGPALSRGRQWIFDLYYKSTHAPIEPDVLDSFGLAPIRKERAMRYGAFLLGYQARALGGSLDVRRETALKTAVPLEFHLSIPV